MRHFVGYLGLLFAALGLLCGLVDWTANVILASLEIEGAWLDWLCNLSWLGAILFSGLGLLTIGVATLMAPKPE